MKVQYFGGRKQIPGKGRVLKYGDILDWEGDLVMGMVPISPTSPGRVESQFSDVGETDLRSPTSEKPKGEKPKVGKDKEES